MDAWGQLIARYEGRLLAFVDNRLTNRSASEDIVQETLIGFLKSLPNYDGRRSLESYLFSICAYKLTDYLRREGRRPAIPLSTSSDTSGDWQIAGRARPASSIASQHRASPTGRRCSDRSDRQPGCSLARTWRLGQAEVHRTTYCAGDGQQTGCRRTRDH